MKNFFKAVRTIFYFITGQILSYVKYNAAVPYIIMMGGSIVTVFLLFVSSMDFTNKAFFSLIAYFKIYGTYGAGDLLKLYGYISIGIYVLGLFFRRLFPRLYWNFKKRIKVLFFVTTGMYTFLFGTFLLRFHQSFGEMAFPIVFLYVLTFLTGLFALCVGLVMDSVQKFIVKIDSKKAGLV